MKYEVTPEILRDAAKSILGRRTAGFMCHELRSAIERAYDFPGCAAEIVSPRDIAEDFLHPHLRADGIPADGTWLEDEVEAGEIGVYGWNFRRYGYLMDLAAKLEGSCT